MASADPPQPPFHKHWEGGGEGISVPYEVHLHTRGFPDNVFHAGSGHFTQSRNCTLLVQRTVEPPMISAQFNSSREALYTMAREAHKLHKDLRELYRDFLYALFTLEHKTGEERFNDMKETQDRKETFESKEKYREALIWEYHFDVNSVISRVDNMLPEKRTPFLSHFDGLAREIFDQFSALKCRVDNGFLTQVNPHNYPFLLVSYLNDFDTSVPKCLAILLDRPQPGFDTSVIRVKPSMLEPKRWHKFEREYDYVGWMQAIIKKESVVQNNDDLPPTKKDPSAPISFQGINREVDKRFGGSGGEDDETQGDGERWPGSLNPKKRKVRASFGGKNNYFFVDHTQNIF